MFNKRDLRPHLTRVTFTPLLEHRVNCAIRRHAVCRLCQPVVKHTFIYSKFSQLHGSFAAKTRTHIRMRRTHHTSQIPLVWPIAISLSAQIRHHYCGLSIIVAVCAKWPGRQVDIDDTCARGAPERVAKFETVVATKSGRRTSYV